MVHGVGNFQFRIAKLGTRPKGGNPQDNCEFKSKESGDRRTKRRRGETETRRSLFVSAFLAVSPFRPFSVSFRFASNLQLYALCPMLSSICNVPWVGLVFALRKNHKNCGSILKQNEKILRLNLCMLLFYW